MNSPWESLWLSRIRPWQLPKVTSPLVSIAFTRIHPSCTRACYLLFHLILESLWLPAFSWISLLGTRNKVDSIAITLREQSIGRYTFAVKRIVGMGSSKWPKRRTECLQTLGEDVWACRIFNVACTHMALACKFDLRQIFIFDFVGLMRAHKKSKSHTTGWGRVRNRFFYTLIWFPRICCGIARRTCCREMRRKAQT